MFANEAHFQVVHDRRKKTEIFLVMSHDAKNWQQIGFLPFTSLFLDFLTG